MNTASDSRLGRDFWLFQTGQMISTVGDACGNIALAWWILDVTASPRAISAVLAPAMLLQTMLTLLLGPLGDRLSRKRLLLSADLFRGVMMAVLALLTAQEAFVLPVVLGVYMLFAAGSALFNSNNLSIVPQIVSAGALQGAVRMSQSLQAIGRVLGGVIGGMLVSWIGVGSAFVFDAASFGVATLATAAILDPSSGGTPTARGGQAKYAPTSFLRDLRDGFGVIHRVPVLFWLCIAIAFFNVVLSPMQVLLPTYAKLAKGMPAWFLGGLESSLGLGIIAGAVGIGALERVPRVVSTVIIGLIFVGGATALLPHVPGIIPPMMMMFLVGLGAAWTNIPIGTRVSVAVPDHFRSRINSIIAFLFDASAPIGVAAGGVLVATFGVTPAMTVVGLAMLVPLPALFRIPGFIEFFRRSPSELTNYFLKAYPHAFDSSEGDRVPGPPATDCQNN